MSPDDNFRDSTDVAQTTFCGIEEVIHLLRGDGHRKAVVRRRKCGHKDLTLHFLTGLNVHIGHRVPSEVHEQVLATIPIRRQHEGWLLCLCILIDMITELSLTIPLWISYPVLAPEKIHCHVFPLQFRCDIWETLLEVLEPPAAVRRTATRQHTLNLWLFHGRSAGMGIPQDSAKVMYLLTAPLYRSSLRSIDRFDSPSRWRRKACLILFISLHLPAMACSIYG